MNIALLSAKRVLLNDVHDPRNLLGMLWMRLMIYLETSGFLLSLLPLINLSHYFVLVGYISTYMDHVIVQ